MPEPLKTFFSSVLVERLAAELCRVEPGFASRAFCQSATCGLEALELVDRGRHIARALAEHLPQSYPEAISILLRSLGPEHAEPELVGAGMAPFFYLPHVLFVAERGLEHFELSMHAQYELTKRFSAEGSIRAYIERYPERCFEVLRTWTTDPNAHVRRLVSEGTRLRLPWAARVAFLDRNPERVLALLERLKADPTPFVRRSVANNLNDLGKVHPGLLTRTCQTWLREDASSERRALVKHALRSAVKRADPQALALLGFGARPSVSIKGVRLAPARVRLGGRLSIQCSLQSTARTAQDLLVDFAVHFVKADGHTAPKVFKGKRVKLAPGAEVRLENRISFAPMSTRRHYPGRHHAELLINGVGYALGAFEVR